MATHRDVDQIASFSCVDCDFEQLKVGGGRKWINLIERLHKKRCKKAGRTQEMTSQDKIILMTTCSGKIGGKSQKINRQSGIGRGQMEQEYDLPRLYHQKLGTFKQKMTEKVQKQIQDGCFKGIIPKDAKLGKPRMINIDSTDGVAMLVGQQKILAKREPDKKRNLFITKGNGEKIRGQVIFEPDDPDNISRKIMTHIK